MKIYICKSIFIIGILSSIFLNKKYNCDQIIEYLGNIDNIYNYTTCGDNVYILIKSIKNINSRNIYLDEITFVWINNYLLKLYFNSESSKKWWEEFKKELSLIYD